MAILSSKGFVYPVTPSGKASLLDLMTEPSHRIAGDSLIIEFRVDPAVLREYVPEPLELDGSGTVFLWTYEGWVFTDRHDTEFISPARTSYCESFFFIPCDYEGERYHYNLFSWVNRDWLAFAGRHGGIPHKVADVSLTRFHPRDPIYDVAKPGVRLAVDVQAVGQVLRATCDLERQIPVEELPLRMSDDYCPRFLGWRYFWDICENRPAVSDLVAHWGDSMHLGPVWTGPASLEFFDAENEEVLPFQPLSVVGGWYFTLRFDHRDSPPRVIHRFEPGAESRGTKAGFLANKQGYRYPLTPSGKASLLDLMTEETHRIAGDSLIIQFEADPAVVREYVPEPLELDGSGTVYLWNYEGWVYTERASTEFVSPERISYCESFFYIPCDHKGERYHFMPYSWVNRDWLAFLGRHHGQPHVLADVSLTRFHPRDPVYDGPKPGVRLAVDVQRYGQVLRATTDLEREVAPTELPLRIANDYCPRFLGWRRFWDICEGRPAVNDLVAHWGDSMHLGPVWTGPASLEFFDAENEEVLPFQPRRVVGGWYFSLLFDHKQSPPVVIHSF